MKRRVIKQGIESHTITLPKKWIKDFHIKPGQEIDITQQERSLVITPDFTVLRKIKKLKFDLSTHHIVMWRIIGAAYVTGYQEIVIELVENKKTKQTFTSINKMFDNVAESLIGMEIVEQTKNKTVLKELASANIEEFHYSLKRMFFILKTMIKELIEGIKEKDKQKIESVLASESVLNRFSKYCMRLLNHFGYTDYDKTVDVYKAVDDLEILSDEIILFIQDVKPISKIQLKALEKIIELLDQAFSVMYKKDFDLAMQAMDYIKHIGSSEKYKEIHSVYEMLGEVFQAIIQVII